MRWRPACLVLLLPFVLGSCAGAPPAPADRFYRLPDPQVSAGRALTTGLIKVARFEADGVYRERAVLFTDDGRGLSLEQYRYHFWTDAPPQMLQHQMIAYLRNAGAASTVVHKPSAEAELTVSGRVKRFERDISGSAPVAQIVLELSLERDDAGAPLLSKDYSASVGAASDAFTDSVAAFAQGVAEIFDAFLADAGERLQP